MIDAKNAVRRAIDYFLELSATTGEKVRNVRVEEVTNDGTVWTITLSFLHDSDETTRAQALGEKPKREYKEFDVFGDDGTIRSMKIRALTL